MNMIDMWKLTTALKKNKNNTDKKYNISIGECVTDSCQYYLFLLVNRSKEKKIYTYTAYNTVITLNGFTFDRNMCSIIEIYINFYTPKKKLNTYIKAADYDYHIKHWSTERNGKLQLEGWTLINLFIINLRCIN